MVSDTLQGSKAIGSKTTAIVEPDLPSDLKDLDFSVKYSNESYLQYINSYSSSVKKNRFFLMIKRIFDIFASALGIIVLFPILLFLSIAVKLDSKGPIFFKQKRMGKNGKPFTCIKFRSMREDTPHDVATSVIKGQDKYMTKVGKFLRKCSLDELPQLFCSFIGTMSLVGPRPVVLSEEHLIDMRRKLGVESMRPGITGLAQVSGRDAVYYKNKAIIDATYVKDASVWLDFKILLLTLKVVFTHKGAK